MSAVQFCSVCPSAQPYVNSSTRVARLTRLHTCPKDPKWTKEKRDTGGVLGRAPQNRKKKEKQTDGGTRAGRQKHAHAAPIYSHACTRGDP